MLNFNEYDQWSRTTRNHTKFDSKDKSRFSIQADIFNEKIFSHRFFCHLFVVSPSCYFLALSLTRTGWTDRKFALIVLYIVGFRAVQFVKVNTMLSICIFMQESNAVWMETLQESSGHCMILFEYKYNLCYLTNYFIYMYEKFLVNNN